MIKLTEMERHQLKVARMVLKTPDELVRVMGGYMTKKEAQEIVDKLKAKTIQEESEKI